MNTRRKTESGIAALAGRRTALRVFKTCKYLRVEEVLVYCCRPDRLIVRQEAGRVRSLFHPASHNFAQSRTASGPMPRVQRPARLRRAASLWARVDFPLTPAKVGKQFQTAEQLGATYAVLVGDEWPQVKLKHLASRTEELISPAQLPERLSAK